MWCTWLDEALRLESWDSFGRFWSSICGYGSRTSLAPILSRLHQASNAGIHGYIVWTADKSSYYFVNAESFKLSWSRLLWICWKTTTTLNSFNGVFCRTTWVSWHQKGRTILDFTEARDDGVAVASAGPYANYLHHTPDTLDNHASTSSLTFFTGCMLFLTSNQQCQSTEQQMDKPMHKNERWRTLVWQ